MSVNHSHIPESERRGWVTLNDGTWWYGNGNTTPYNWTKQFDQSVKGARERNTGKPQQGQLSLFTI